MALGSSRGIIRRAFAQGPDIAVWLIILGIGPFFSSFGASLMELGYVTSLRAVEKAERICREDTMKQMISNPREPSKLEAAGFAALVWFCVGVLISGWIVLASWLILAAVR
jgi:hypothetical protein